MIKQTVRFFFGIAVFLLGFTASLALDMEELVILGSRGPARSALDSSVPVDVIDAAALEQVSAYGGELGEVLLALAPAASQEPAPGQRGAPPTTWGDPDLQGIWTSDYETPLERPARYADQEFFSD